MQYRFDPPGKTFPGHDGSGPGLEHLPQALLDRHGARVLHPSSAPVAEGWPAPRSTVYRARTLLVPRTLHNQGFFAQVTLVLEPVGMLLTPVAGPQEVAEDQDLADVPTIAVLTPIRDGRPPVVVDAWVALTALRDATSPHKGGSGGGPDRDDHDANHATAARDGGPILDVEAVRQITLEHLLVGAMITGSPEIDGNPEVDGNPAIPPYLSASGDSRIPVDVYAGAPPRLKAEHYDGKARRRPVVVVADTGPRVHPWLNVTARNGGGYDTQTDGFVQIDPTMQAAILSLGEAAGQAGDDDRKPIKGPWDTPETPDPLVGVLEPAVGHCTFISGIFRQVVPEATVLSLRVMHSDDVVNEGELIAALALLAARVAKVQASASPGSAMIDAISLSLGYYDESPSDLAYSSGLWTVIKKLLDRGVPVFAAAGNNSSARPFWPAAFAAWPAGPGAPPVFSVGALNPNGTCAMFSDDGAWVTAWASGASVVSTFPTDISGGLMPAEKSRGRESLNPDDFRSGFCVWNGTSFSAPALAAEFLKALLAGAQAAPLTDVAQAATVARAVQALRAMGWKGP